jgi:hypothetical protein
MKKISLLVFGLLAFVALRASAQEVIVEPPYEHEPAHAGILHIRRWAIPSNNPHYFGYYVGGGARRKGHLPGPEDGTWGWDYRGWIIQRRVDLLWGGRYQGGTGRYKTDGPHLPELPHEGGHEEGHENGHEGHESGHEEKH